MSLPMMAAALAATTLGVALLTAPTQAQDPNASAATAAQGEKRFRTCDFGRPARDHLGGAVLDDTRRDAVRPPSAIKVPPSPGNNSVRRRPRRRAAIFARPSARQIERNRHRAGIGLDEDCLESLDCLVGAAAVIGRENSLERSRIRHAERSSSAPQ